MNKAIRAGLMTLGALAAAVGLRADLVETSGGARLVGHLTKIADGKVYLETGYAGPIVVDQAQVVRISTDGPVAVGLAGGKRYDGRLAGAGDSEQIATPTGLVTTKVAEIAATWTAGAVDPRTLQPRYHWTYEASVNVTGKSGNHSQFGSAYGVTATLKRARDSLTLSSAYDRQVTDGVKSADQFKGGVDYSDNYGDRSSWYARDEGGFDRIKELTLYDTAAVGAGYDLVKRARQTLTVRAGLAYRYDHFSVPTAPNVASAGLDLGLKHSVRFANAILTTTVAVVPAFDNLRDVLITHETDFDVPLAKSTWKLRLGLADNFVGRPPPGIKELDTTYFGSLVWDFQPLKLVRFVPRHLRWWQK